MVIGEPPARGPRTRTLRLDSHAVLRTRVLARSRSWSATRNSNGAELQNFIRQREENRRTDLRDTTSVYRRLYLILHTHRDTFISKHIHPKKITYCSRIILDSEGRAHGLSGKPEIKSRATLIKRRIELQYASQNVSNSSIKRKTGKHSHSRPAPEASWHSKPCPSAYSSMCNSRT